MEFLFPRRIARIAYLIRTIILSIAITLLIDHYDQLDASGRAAEGIFLVVSAVALFAYWVGFVVAPRCRDLAMSAWFSLIMLVPVIDVVIAGYLAWGRTKVRAEPGDANGVSSPVAPRERKSEGLRRLEAMRDEGLLTEQDFLRRKARLEREQNL